MKRTYLYALMLGVCSATSVAKEMSAKISAVNNLWVSAQTESGGLVPSEWDMATALPTGEKLIPGSVSNNGIQSVILNGATDSISLNVSVLGIQYMTGEYASTEADAQGSATTQVTGNQVVVTGTGIGNQALVFANNSSMVKLFRPIFSDITISELQTALAGKPKGVYQGNLPVVFSYDYYRHDVRVKQLMTINVLFSIDYNPAVIFDAVITLGIDGVLTPSYHGNPTVVSAQGMYRIQITGDFTSGLRAKVLDPALLYTLKNNQVHMGSVDNEIAYSVTCVTGCLSNQAIITEGVASSQFTQLDNANTTESNLELRVHFENKPYEDLQSGDYQGQFQLMFEAEL